MTVRPGLLFFFSIPSPPSPYYGLLLCLVDCAPSLLSITCLTFAFTALPTRASVPADVHPLCTVPARISSPLPYVSSHPLCTPPYPLTCVVPRPFVQDDPWADYDGQYDAYDDIDWEAQDRSP